MGASYDRRERTSRNLPINRFASLRVQLVALVAAIVLPLVAASGWIAWQQYQAQREALAQTLLSVARALSAGADRELATALTLVETLSHSPLLDEGRFAEFHALAVKTLASRPGAFVVLFEPSGQMRFSTLRPFGMPLPNVFEQEARLPKPRADELVRGGQAYLRRALETRRPSFSDLFEGQTTGNLLVAVTVPVLRQGQALWALVVAFPAATFQPLVERQPRLIGSGAVIFDSRGFIVARAVKPEEFVGKRVPPEVYAAMQSAAESVERGVNMQGERFFRAVARSPITGWSAGVALSEEAAFGTMWRSLRDSAVAAAVILAVGIAGALFLARAYARRREAEEASRAKDRFIAVLSHELRNPLASIALAADLLERVVGREPRAADALGILSRQVAQLRRLLDDLLDTARAIYGKLAIAPRPVDLRAAAGQVAQAYERRPGVRIELRGGELWVNADPARLHQMLDNLVENAVRYGARHIGIEIAAQASAGEVRVTDDGQGIAPQLLPRLFEPFVQGEQSMARAEGGLGLGLALVKRLAHLHGGSVRAESDGPGKGSRFVLALPLAAAEAAVLAAPPAPRAIDEPRRVLVVEDLEDSRESLRRLLEMEGFQVAVAADGAAGLDTLRRFQPHIAVIDVGLPGMDGYALAREARRHAGAGLTLIALTGYGQAEDRQRALQAGFELHFTKPVPTHELLDALRMTSSRAKASGE